MKEQFRIEYSDDFHFVERHTRFIYDESVGRVNEQIHDSKEWIYGDFSYDGCRTDYYCNTVGVFAKTICETAGRKTPANRLTLVALEESRLERTAESLGLQFDKNKIIKETIKE